ncbi:isoprenyl transferase [Sandaracinobacteroides sp. A072]|uniref:isoprenyl transferase n=1 Tax=Sandaracinobacteroides sp. A072 TaxID=3461146 RepID=UPI0040434911
MIPGGPRHVAIIMDGNGRWAKARHMPRLAGHKAGVDAVRRIVRAAPRLGVETLTLYAFSSENWRRPAEEVSDLMSLLRHHLLAELEELDRNGARLGLIGDWRALKPDIVERLENAMEATRHNSRFQLVVALNYGGQDELTRAVQSLAARVAAGEIAPAAITPQLIEAALDTAALPPVDLIIRTSGEQRLSNFLLWQAAYAELWFTPTLWPDFDEAVLREAVETFARRERRYGGL